MGPEIKGRPEHVAVIMDGNGRWAELRGLSRGEGHLAGAESVRVIVRACVNANIKYLTLFAFSTENWSRPGMEVGFLMQQLALYLANNRENMLEEGIRFRAIGCLTALPDDVQEEIRRTESMTAGCERLHLTMAINYGSRAELSRVCRELAGDAAGGAIRSEHIDEKKIQERLDTAGLPDPDLLIRTGGEKRLSNFLLWQLSYSELYFVDTLWPDFTEEDLHLAIHEFAGRERRFGRLKE